jgi:hypothetical protein
MIGIEEPESSGESESDKNRIRPEKTVIGEEATVREQPAIDEKAIVGEKVAVKIIESTVEESTSFGEAWTLKLVKSASVKTHTASLKTSGTTAMKPPAPKPPRHATGASANNAACLGEPDSRQSHAVSS